MDFLNDKKIKEFIINFLISTPKAIAILFFSFFSGQVWAYLIITYFKSKTKGNAILNNKYTKTGVGLLWFIIVAMPYNLYMHGAKVNFENIIQHSIICILIGATLQAIVFGYLTTFKTEK
jgi:hypothetical protein